MRTNDAWRSLRVAALLTAAIAFAPPPAAAGQVPAAGGLKQTLQSTEDVTRTDWPSQLVSLEHGLIRLPFAVVASAVLALRPRRRGTPRRQAAVVQTQIILAIVGAVVMLVVGASLARAFGIVGAAGLIRYRAKIADPKDAGVMLSTLAVGLASGVGLYLLAGFATLFILVTLWVLESMEPQVFQHFLLTMKMKDPSKLRPAIEGLFKRQHVGCELRSTADDEVSYELKMPLNKNTDKLSDALAALDRGRQIEMTWEKEKVKA